MHILNKRKKNYIICLCLFFFSASIFAQVTVNKTSGCAPLTNVNFSSPTTGNWVFGNGASATGTNVTATYAKPGTYNVTFSQGGSIVYTETITVYGKPSPDFSVNNTSGCAPLSTIFTDASTGGGGTSITNWQWAFGDGGTSTQQNPNYNYTFVGDFSVALTVTDQNGCDSSISKSSFISTSSAPTASFTTTPSPATSCLPPLIVGLNNNSQNSTGGTTGLTYSWDFGNGQTSTDANPASLSYNQQGNFPIQLTVTQNGSCSRSTTRNVNIGNPLAVIDLPDTVCINVEYDLINNSLGGSSFVWTIDGTTNYNTKTPKHTFTTEGTQTINLIANSGAGCLHDTTINVYVQELKPSFTSTPNYICDDPYCITYTNTSSSENLFVSWSTENGVFTNDNAEVCYPLDTNRFFINEKQFKNTTITTTSTAGCIGRFSKADTIYPVTAFFFPDTAMGCAPLTVNFSDSSRSGGNIVSWDYDFGDGNTSTNQDPTHTFTNPGEYIVNLIVTNDRGCTDTSYNVVIQVGEKINLDFSITPNQVCVGEDVVFTDLSNDPNIDYYHFSVEGNKTKSCPQSNQQTYTPQNDLGFKDVTYYANYNGCITDTVITDGLEIIGSFGEFYYVGDCSNPLTYDFIGTIDGATQWDWNFGDGDSIVNSNQDSVRHTFASSGDYVVKLTPKNSGSCSNQTYSVIVKVRQVSAGLNLNDTYCADQEYNFDASNSVDVNDGCNTGYHWDLGPKTVPQVTTDPFALFEFSDTGTYNLRLIVTDVNGCRDTTSKEFRIGDIYAEISVDNITGCIPLTINFTDSTKSDTLITRWRWLDPLNQLISNSDTAQVTLTSTTTRNYRYTLIVQDSTGCIDTTDISINPILPDTNFTATPRNICIGDSVRFTASGGASLSTLNWEFNDLTPNQTGNNIYHTFDTTGFFDITLTLVDTNGCNGTRTIKNYINVQDYPDAGFFTNYDTLSAICYPVTVLFTDSTISNFPSTRRWDLGTGGQVVNSSTVGTTYNAPGNYNISLFQTTSNGCRDTATKVINIIGPVANFTISKNNLCVGDSITFTITDSSDVETFYWDFGDGTTATGFSPITHQFTSVPDGGSTLVQLIMYSQDSICDATRAKPISIQLVEARFDITDSIICLNEVLEVQNNSLGADINSWDFGDNKTSNQKDPSDVTYNNAGNYTVILRVENIASGCKDSLIEPVIVNPIPEVSIPNFAICLDDSIFVVAQGAETYQWEPADLASDPTNDSTYLYPTESAQFNVTGTDTNGCSNTFFSDVLVIEPISDITIDTCVVIGQTFTIGKDFGPGYTYSWNNSSTTDWFKCIDCPIQQDINITDEVGTLDLVLTYSDTLNCFDNSVFYGLCVRPSYTFSLPNAFTPDGDNVNDIILLKGHGIEKLDILRIYNRWGEIVFETTDINQGWDGIYKGQEQGMETFIYEATVTFFNGKTVSKSGSFTLIR